LGTKRFTSGGNREIWLLTIGTIIVEIPVAFAAFTILSH